MLAVGVDVAEARKGLDLVALDASRGVVDCRRRLTVDDVARIALHELQPEVVCIDSPSGWSTSGPSRLAERRLAAVGIQSFRTGADPGNHPFYAWMRVGFEIFDALHDTYPLYRGGLVNGTAAEVFPNASAVLLAGQLRSADESKLNFRRRVLEEQGVRTDALTTLDLIDAALCALTGLIGLAGNHLAIGDPNDGVILSPVPALPAHRLRVAEPSPPLAKRPITAGGERNALHPSGMGEEGATTEGHRAVSKPPRRTLGRTTAVGYVNRNRQAVLRATGLPGTDHGQYVYVLRCGRCEEEYGANGSDIHLRRCPACDGGRPGLPIK
jgi:predicted RNase H-like nuclease